MKTLKSIKQESIKFYSENAGTYFSKSFTKKMGGTQTIVFEDDFLPKIELNKKEYYSGRGAKYNTTSMHEHIDVFVTKKEFNERVNSRAKSIFNQQKQKADSLKKMADFCKLHGLKKSNYSGLYGAELFFTFGKKNEVEKELEVDLTDFFNASGKTYYFTSSKIGNLRFYHNHRQSYSFNFTTDEEINKFQKDRESWISAPYAELLGQTENKNLFVC